MKRMVTMAILLILAVSMAHAQDSTEHNLMPVPKEFKFGEGKVQIDGTFKAILSNYSEPRLQLAVKKFYARIFEQTGIIFQPTDQMTGSDLTLAISVDGPGEKIQTVNENESYTLNISGEGAVLKAATPVGALRGMETFLQLIETTDYGFGLPLVAINDSPRFKWRGLLVDSCRHWQPKEVIYRTLDAMAACKMNVLHWHLSEDQGFRVESKVFPELHKQGSDGYYYTQEEIKDIVAHARNLGIRVMPEFDIPGHSTSWLVGYPELGSQPGPYEIARKFGVHHPVLDPSNEEVYRFLDKFIGEMVTLFPDAYFHIGGDEVEDTHWKESEQIQAFMKAKGFAESPELQTYFNSQLLPILEKHGKKMIGWDEIFQPDLPTSIVIQSWRGKKSLAEAAKLGYLGILSNGYYIDLFQSAEFHYSNDPLKGPAEELSEEEKARILGGEATMWGELITPEVIDSRIWPRTAAIAERFWSPQSVEDIDDMYRRLEIQSQRLALLGLNHLTIQQKIFQRIVGFGKDIKPLVTLAEVVEPLSGYWRHRIGKYQTFTPLNRFVDGVPSDSMTSIKFNKAVKSFTGNKADYEESAACIRSVLEKQRDNYRSLLMIIDGNEKLNELFPLAEEINILTEIGLKALNLLETGASAGHEWFRKVELILAEEKLTVENAPLHEMEIRILPGIRDLTAKVLEIQRTALLK